MKRQNAELKAHNTRGSTPFLTAMESGDPDIVRLLLDRADAACM